MRTSRWMMIYERMPKKMMRIPRTRMRNFAWSYNGNIMGE